MSIASELFDELTECATRLGKNHWAETGNTPPYRVRVKSKAGRIYESKPFISTSQVEYIYWGWRALNESSRFQAERLVNMSVKIDRFYYPEENLYIPMCEIEYLQVTNEDLIPRCGHGIDGEDCLECYPPSGAV